MIIKTLLTEIRNIKLLSVKDDTTYTPDLKRSILLVKLGIVKFKNLLLKESVKHYIIFMFSEGLLDILSEIMLKFIYCNDTIYYCLWIIHNISFHYYNSYTNFLSKNYQSVYMRILNKRNENVSTLKYTI